MTCVVGLAESGCVYLGCDSACTNNYDQQSIRSDKKVFKRQLAEEGEMIFGACGSVRMSQLLHYRLKLPIYEPKRDPLVYMATSFIDAVRLTFKEGGFATKEHEQEVGGNFLVGFHGLLFCIESDYQVEVIAKPYNAIGSATDLACGVMYATQGSALLAEERITLALEAAAYHNAVVRSPFVIEKVVWHEKAQKKRWFHLSRM